MKTLTLTLFVLLLVLSHLPAIITAQDSKPGSSEIEMKLEQIVSLRAVILERHEALYADNIKNDILGAKMELLRAKLALSREKGEHVASKDYLQQIVALLQKQYETSMLSVELGQGDQTDVLNRKIEILNAEIELARLDVENGQ